MLVSATTTIIIVGFCFMMGERLIEYGIKILREVEQIRKAKGYIHGRIIVAVGAFLAALFFIFCAIQVSWATVTLLLNL